MRCFTCGKKKKYDVERVQEQSVSGKKELNDTYSKQDETVSFTVLDTQEASVIRKDKGVSSRGRIVKDNEKVGTKQDGVGRLEELQRTKELELEKERLGKENKSLENGSVANTSTESKLTNLKGNFENINDEVNNTRLAQRFESLYSQKWVLLIKWMVKHCQTISEVDRISLLTNIMKIGYERCKALAERELNNLLDIKNIKDVPANVDISVVKQKRKQDGIEKSARQRIAQDITANLLQLEAKNVCTLCSGDNSETAKSKLQIFVEEYIECCWLMSISIPTMVLVFNVVGKHYTICADHFKVYSTKRPVEDMTKVEGEICEVVWPCVLLEDVSAIYMKGDVIVVKKGKQAK